MVEVVPSEALKRHDRRHYASNLPENTVYGGPQTPSAQRVTLNKLLAKYRKGEPISVVTAYDYPSAVHVSPPLFAWRHVR